MSLFWCGGKGGRGGPHGRTTLAAAKPAKPPRKCQAAPPRKLQLSRDLAAKMLSRAMKFTASRLRGLIGTGCFRIKVTDTAEFTNMRIIIPVNDNL